MDVDEEPDGGATSVPLALVNDVALFDGLLVFCTIGDVDSDRYCNARSDG